MCREDDEAFVVEIREEHHHVIIQLCSVMFRVLRLHQVSVCKCGFIPVMAVCDQYLLRFHLLCDFLDRPAVGDHPELVPDILKRDIHSRRR